MNPGQETLRKRMDAFRTGLKRAGIKMTPQRLEIFREVAKSEEHPDAKAIFRGVRARLPSISPDTVYRTLWLLFDLGLLSTLGPARERTRFDANMSPHHHFVCTRCGMTRDFHNESFDRLRIHDTVQTWGNAETARVEIRGICLKCSKRATA